MILSEYKNIIKFAMENEVEAQKFYEEAAQKVQSTQLKEMFTDFAQEEKKHREILKQVYISNRMGDYFHEGQDYHIAEDVDLPVLSTDMKPADAIALAMKKEEAAMAQYTELADSCPEPDKKKVFLDLAAMERGHKLRMENAFVDIGFPEVW
ncbi:MAG: ferritin family protein [Desulfobacterales bacterium]|nr:ferritin family protein [Desulfobacterales bacterium]MDX2510961.1 ferritin family protein [Desulfobacterales bacterium]